MPYKVHKLPNGKYKAYRQAEGGRPARPLSNHPQSKETADKQIAAIKINEGPENHGLEMFVGPPDEKRDETGKWTSGSGHSDIIKSLRGRSKNFNQLGIKNGDEKHSAFKELQDKGLVEPVSGEGGMPSFRLTDTGNKHSANLPKHNGPENHSSLSMYSFHKQPSGKYRVAKRNRETMAAPPNKSELISKLKLGEKQKKKLDMMSGSL